MIMMSTIYNQFVGRY